MMKTPVGWWGGRHCTCLRVPYTARLSHRLPHADNLRTARRFSREKSTMKNMRSRVLNSLVAALFACAACMAAHAQGGPGAAPQPVRLAMIEGLSGPFGNTGEAVW